MESCSGSLVFLGSQSCQLAQEMIDLGKIFDLSDQRDHMLVVADDLASAQSFKTKKTTMHLETLELTPCIHKNNSFCTLCSESLHEFETSYRNMMERGTLAGESCIICDLGSYKDMWRYFNARNLTSECCKSTKSVFLLPPNPIAGFDIFCSLYSLTQAIQSNSAIIIRSLRESLYSDENIDTHFPKPSTRSDALERIAADLLIPLYVLCHSSNDMSILWPANVCSYNSRVFDIRSSLYYSLKQMKKRQSTTNTKSNVHKSWNEQLPYRIVASSIHHLNNYYRSSDLFFVNSIFENKSFDQKYLLDYRECKINSQLGVVEFTTSLSKSTSEMKSVMSHATPGLDWMIVNDFFHNNETSTTSASTKSLSPSSSHIKDVAIASFQSEFGDMEIRRIAESARQMIRVRAYNRYFTEEFSRETILDCLAVVDDYFDRR